jgi:hypothetical protein
VWDTIILTKVIISIGILLALSLPIAGWLESTMIMIANAQSDLQAIKYRNLVIDLGNGVKTNAQLAYPAIGKGQFPGVLLIPGTGAVDMNSTLANNARPFWQIANYLSERGFAVLRYDKRGVGVNHTILDTNVWGNVTVNDLIHDADKALNVDSLNGSCGLIRISTSGNHYTIAIITIDNKTSSTEQLWI